MAAASAWQPCWKSCIAEGVFHKEISIASIACSTPPKARLAWTRNLASLQLCLQQPHLALRIACSASVSHGGETPVKLEDINFKKLQNGSDIRGVAIEGVEGEPVNLSEVATEAIAAAFSDWLVERKSGKRQLRISVGHDSRISADVLQAAVARGVAGAGLDVILYGLASTPAMFNSTITNREDLFCPVDGAIMITASHLPYNRNGLKFFTSDGGLGKGDISSILARAAKIYGSLTEERLHASARAAANVVKHANFMNHYASDLVETVRRAAGDNPQPLEGFHIIVDAGNGAGGFFAGSVLAPLGAITSGSQFLEPDGMFPNHIPNPEDKEAMDAIQKAVIEHKADLGIIFDTDVDRAAAVDSSGREINRNRLIALISAIVLAEHPGTTIVTDSVTSDGLTTFIEEKLGGKHHRYKRGYKNVIDEGIRLNAAGQECHLAIETSGHGALKENHWLDDGAYLMVKVLVKLAAAKASGEGGGSKVLTDLIEELQEAEVALEFRIKIDQNHPDIIGRSFQEYGNAVLSHLESLSEKASELKKAPVNYEGVRISGFGGWFLLRLSLHDPVLPLNIEAPSHETASKLGSLVISSIKDFKALNLKPVEQYLAQNKVVIVIGKQQNSKVNRI